jgi:translation elongation factor EF-G
VSKLFVGNRDVELGKEKEFIPDILSLQEKKKKQKNADTSSEDIMKEEDGNFTPNNRDSNINLEKKQDNFIAFSRVFSGTLEVGMDSFNLLIVVILFYFFFFCLVLIIQPHHSPLRGKFEAVRKKVRGLYLLRGKNLIEVNKVKAGCICGISGICFYFYFSFFFMFVILKLFF